MIVIHATTFATMRRFLSRRSDGSGCRSARQSAYSVIIGASLEGNSKTSGSLAAVSLTSRSLAIIGELAAGQRAPADYDPSFYLSVTNLAKNRSAQKPILLETDIAKNDGAARVVVRTAMLRQFESRIESNLRISSTICDYAWLRQTERSTRSVQDQLSAFRQKDFLRRTNIFRCALRK
jgi:hypothetical protein